MRRSNHDRRLRVARDRAINTTQHRAPDRKGEGQGYIDYGFHPAIFEPAQKIIDEMAAAVAEGYPSLKIFMIGLARFDELAHNYMEVIGQAGKLGTLTNIHAEDQCIMSHLTEQLNATCKFGVRHFAESRPRGGRNRSPARDRDGAFMRRRRFTSFICRARSRWRQAVRRVRTDRSSTPERGQRAIHGKCSSESNCMVLACGTKRVKNTRATSCSNSRARLHEKKGPGKEAKLCYSANALMENQRSPDRLRSRTR